MPIAHPTAAARNDPGSCESASCSGGRYVVAFDVRVIDLAQMLVAVCAALGEDEAEPEPEAGGAEAWGAIL